MQTQFKGLSIFIENLRWLVDFLYHSQMGKSEPFFNIWYFLLLKLLFCILKLESLEEE